MDTLTEYCTLLFLFSDSGTPLPSKADRCRRIAGHPAESGRPGPGLRARRAPLFPIISQLQGSYTRIWGNCLQTFPKKRLDRPFLFYYNSMQYSRMGESEEPELIEISNLSYDCRGRRILDRVSMKVSNGKRYGIYGAPGAGKSTLLALLAGALTPQAGQIRINGFDMQREPVQARRCLGYLPQEIGFYRSMTVYELLDFVAAARGVPDNRRFLHVHETLEFSGMSELRNRPLSRLGTAGLRRLGVAQALIGNPEILLLDAPTEGLSHTEARELRELVREIAGVGKTVFLASAIPSEVLELCEEIFLLEEGCLSLPAPADELVRGADLLLQVNGTREAAQTALAGTDGVLVCRPLLPGEDGSVCFRLRMARQGLAAELRAALTAAGLEVLEAEEQAPGEAELALRRSAAGRPPMQKPVQREEETE